MVRFAFGAVLCLVLVALVVPAAWANSTDLLTFQGLTDLQPVGNFYNGAGAGVPNYGVSFSSNFYALKSVYQGGAGAFAADPTNTPAIFINGVTGAQTTGSMNVGPGFTSGISFFYTAAFTETVTIWSGANGTGTVLATVSLAANNSSCSGFPSYCNWSAAGLTFSGTAKSVTFSGGANGIGIADITLGQSTTAIPEPSSFLLMGTGLVAAYGKARRFLRS
jgi:hypothetical protein